MPHFRPLPTLTLSLLLTAALAACNKDTPAPTSSTPPAPASVHTTLPSGKLTTQAITAGSPNVHTVQFTVNTHVVTHIPGQTDLTTDGPTGMTGAYRFTNGTVKARLDAPGAAFRDGRARIAVFTQSGSSIQGGVVFADTLQADPSVPSNAIGTLFQGMSGVAPDAQQPFLKQTSAAWSTRTTQAGDTTSTAARPAGEPGSAYLTVQRSTTTPNQGALSATQYFDPDLGVVTKQTTTLNAPDVTANATTSIDYTSPTDQPTLLIPARITTHQTLTSKRAGESTINVDQQTDYTGIQINALPDSYFDVGGL